MSIDLVILDDISYVEVKCLLVEDEVKDLNVGVRG